MSEPHDHHFIPAFYLSRWAGSDGKLIEFTRKYKKLVAKPVGPRATGFEIDLYETKDLPPEQKQYLEKVWFNYLDDTGADALAIHLNGGSWTNELINGWSRFVLGLHFRHPHAMAELRAGAVQIWEASNPATQKNWDATRKQEDPTSFDDYLATLDPFAAAKVRLNMVIKVFDNPTLVGKLNGMSYAIVDTSAASERLVTSDRPVCISHLGEQSGVVFVPISPTKLFLAVNDEKSLEQIRAQTPLDLVRRVNSFVVGRARLYVWASDKVLEPFIKEKMSTEMESAPFFPNIAKYSAE